MEKKYDEELYEILDEMNANLEEIVNEHTDPEQLEVIIAHLNQKAREFVYDFEQDIEKFELIEMEM